MLCSTIPVTNGNPKYSMQTIRRAYILYVCTAFYYHFPGHPTSFAPIRSYLPTNPCLFTPVLFLSCSVQPQLLIKRLRIRLSSQKLDQCLHLILTASLLQHRMSIPSPFLSVHRICLEYAVEHVGAVDLGGEVAVVAGLNGIS